jgi:DNA-binding CsgD family transcriptional regulator
MRIRRRLQAAADAAAPDAVLTSAGAVSHAETSAQDAQARAVLSRAVKSRETARGPLRRTNPEEAAGLWQALVDGRWSLVDQTDSDGRRWILARRNAPTASELQPLTLRERQVLAYVALGQSNKLVAYTLGLTVSAVSNLISRATHKLGMKNRVDLVQHLNDTTKRNGNGES